ncbi:MAG TPA: L,D-transpeptidase [Candidatus Saccharimonadales bacterium]|nr:L,D-transpeptidase [Candidatus Saccharimonadales bacterium]
MYSYRQRQAFQTKRKKRHPWRFVAAMVIAGGIGAYAWHTFGHTHTATAASKSSTTTTAAASMGTQKTPSPQTKATPCSTNTTNKLIIVSISARHLWACAGSTQQYDSAVVTGQEKLAADLTPTGTYHIYGKQTNLYLKGSDSTGSWNDYVYYWMPFLNNQYGTYGFHDATWRNASDFGNIDPYSSQGSHGCVELPLATAKWIYNWAENGTTVNVVS